jgi:hypothetical protein
VKKKRSARMPIYLSAFGFPGLGQFMQKRWLAGITFSVGFLVGFLWIMILAIQNIIELYSMAFSPNLSYEPTPLPLTAFIEPLLIAGIVYFISLFDVFLAQQKIASRLHEQEFLKANETSDK